VTYSVKEVILQGLFCHFQLLCAQGETRAPILLIGKGLAYLSLAKYDMTLIVTTPSFKVPFSTAKSNIKGALMALIAKSCSPMLMSPKLISC